MANTNHHLDTLNQIYDVVVSHYNDELEIGRRVKRIIHDQRDKRNAAEAELARRSQQEQEWWHQQDQDEQFITENGGES